MLRNTRNIRSVLTNAIKSQSSSICRTKTTLSTQPTTKSTVEASKVIRRQIGSTGINTGSESIVAAASVATSVSHVPVAETSVSVLLRSMCPLQVPYSILITRYTAIVRRFYVYYLYLPSSVCLLCSLNMEHILECFDGVYVEYMYASRDMLWIDTNMKSSQIANALCWFSGCVTMYVPSAWLASF